MNELLERIYREIIYYEKDTVRLEKEITGEVDKLLGSSQLKLDAKELEQLKTLVYEAVLIAEAKSFRLGIRYTIKALLELLAG